MTSTASASGGIGGYSYLWSNGSTSASISNLAPGNYGVTVTDGAGNSFDQTFDVMVEPDDFNGNAYLLPFDDELAGKANTARGSVTKHGIAPVSQARKNM